MITTDSDSIPAPAIGPTTFFDYAWCGLRIALVGSVALGLVECAAASAVSLPHYSDDSWPWGIVIAAAGKALATHLVVWCPVYVCFALGCGLLFRRRTTLAPEALLAPGFVLLAGCLIAPFDLKLAERDTPLRIVLLCTVALAAALILFFVVRRVARKRGRRVVARVLNISTIAAGAVALIAGMVFANSPMLGPAVYRVSPPSMTSSGMGKPERPHVLWIVLDTVRADHMSANGYSQPTTPRLAEFAEDAVVFDRAVSNGIWTLPAHVSMFTGRSLREHGADHRYQRLDESFTTVAEVLRDHGYATAAFSNNPWVAPDTDVTRGFDTTRVIYHLRHVNRSSVGSMAEALGLRPLLPWLDEDFGGAMTNALIADWLVERGDDSTPFFLFVNYMDAHLPYRVPQRYRGMFMTPEEVARSYALALSVYGKIVDALDRRFNFDGRDFLAPPDRDILKKQYDAGIRYTDMRVGELLDMFRARGLLEDTLVVIVSDHGEYLDTHGMWAHRMQAYQDVLDITLMLRPPGGEGGGDARRVSTPVQLSDLFGTVLGATVGLGEHQAAWHARDLLEIAAQGDASDRIVVSEYGGPAPGNLKRIQRCNDPDIPPRAHPQIAAQDRRFKLIATADGTRELYDLDEDPGELHNLIDRLPAEADRLAAYLESWHARTPLFQPPKGDGAADLDPDVIRALKSLGYLGEDD